MPWPNQTSGRGGTMPPSLGVPRAPTTPAVQAGVPVPRAVWLPEITTDFTTRTATTSFAQISGAFTIAAGDAVAGSIYEMTLWGSFTTSSPTINIRPQIFGVNLATLTIQPAVGPYRVDVMIIVTKPGASGSLNGIITWISDLAPIATVIPATTVNTSAASVFEVQGDTSSGNLTGVGSVYSRIGPGAFQ